MYTALQWRHNGRDGVLNHQPHDRLLNRLYRCRSKKTSKIRVTGLYVGNSPATGKWFHWMMSSWDCLKVHTKNYTHGSRLFMCSQSFILVSFTHIIRGYFTARIAGLNTLRQNYHHFQDDIFKCIFNDNVRISIKTSMKFVPKGPTNNIPVLFRIMASHRSGDKSLSEPKMVRLSTHICVTQPQWINKN